MQDASSIHENGSLLSQISEIDYELPPSKLTTAKTRPRAPSRLPPARADPTVSPKTTQHPQKTSNGYAPPASDRESWWRVTIKDTPSPGAYDTHLNTFIKEVTARPMTYGFKSDGRRRDPQPLEPKGKELLPGAYSVEDFADRMNRLQLSYGFKGPQRDGLLKKTMSSNQDKDIDVPPGSYETQKYQTIDASIEPARHSFFRSKTRRKVFLPKLGPAPSDYEPRIKVTNITTPTITSSFRSRTDRFPKSSRNVPGPGTYEKLTVFPKLKQIDSYSTRGIFFNANFSSMSSAAF